MKTIDMHCDTLMLLGIEKGENADLYNDLTGGVDVYRLKQVDALVQFFAIFIVPQGGWKNQSSSFYGGWRNGRWRYGTLERIL